MIHRDIKLKNIGIRRDADGKFYAVIADFGLSTVELDNDVKKSDILQRTLPVKRRFLNIIKKLPKYLNWVKYFFNVHSKNVDDEILLIVKKLENVSKGVISNDHLNSFAFQSSVKAFLDGRGCGTNNWIAPEIDKKCQSQFFFRLDPLYHCRRCFSKNRNGLKAFSIS